MTNNKLGLGIITFEGTEMIAQIVMEIKDLVDFVVIGFQRKSYMGELCDPNDEFEVQKLKNEGIVDEILYIETNTSDFPRLQETEKRNRICEFLEENGCTHQLIIDSDEFYSHDAFARAKEKIYKNNIEISYCRYVNYFHDYQHYLVYPFKEGTYVPFITKIPYRFSWQCVDFDKPSDPTRRYVRPKRVKTGEDGKPLTKTLTRKNKNGEVESKVVPQIEYLVDNYIFEWSELKMHHLSWLRNNIRKKMNAWSSKCYFNNYLEIIDKATERFNNFSDEDVNQSMTLLFNTPNNQLEVAKFNKQYIFPNPQYDYKTRVNNCSYNRQIKFIKLDNNTTFFLTLKTLSHLIEFEEYKDHNNKTRQRPKRTFDFVVLGEYGFKEPIQDFINHIQDESIIYFSDKFCVLGFDSVLKVLKTFDKTHKNKLDWKGGIKDFILIYCEKNDLDNNHFIANVKMNPKTKKLEVKSE